MTKLTNGRGYPVGESHGRCRHPKAIVDRARAMHGQGLGYKAVGSALGVPWRTVADWVRLDTRWAV